MKEEKVKTDIAGNFEARGAQRKPAGSPHQAQETERRESQPGYDIFDLMDRSWQPEFVWRRVNFTLEEPVSLSSMTVKVTVFGAYEVMGKKTLAINFGAGKNSKRYVYSDTLIHRKQSLESLEPYLGNISDTLFSSLQKKLREAVEEYGEFPHYTLSSKNVSKLLDPSTENAPDTPVVTVEKMVNKIRAVFGLNMAQIANVIGVSAASLHDHLVGKDDAPESHSPYQALYDLALEIAAETTVPLKPGLKSILIDGKTLLGHLKEKNFDREKILRAARVVSRELAESKKPGPVSVEEQRRICRLYTKAG